jgi:serine/threonine-protein kinase RsbW
VSLAAAFPPRIEALGAVFGFTAEACTAFDLPADARRDIDFVVEELFTNMAKYGAGRGPVRIEVRPEDDGVEVVLTEFDADRFDPTADPRVDITRPAAERRPGGLGLHLVQRLVRSIDYDYAPDARCGRTRFRPRTMRGPADGGEATC